MRFPWVITIFRPIFEFKNGQFGDETIFSPLFPDQIVKIQFTTKEEDTDTGVQQILHILIISDLPD
jgi:hypothetical protein